MSAPNLNRLQGKRALVTAGGQGIGLAITRHLLAAGCDVAVHYHSSAVDTDALRSDSPRDDVKIVSLQADLRDRDAARGLATKAVEALGGLDVLVNNAGSLLARKSLGELDEPFFDDTFALNVASMAWVTQGCLPALQKAGRAGGASVVNLASLAGRKGGHGGSLLYSTAKGAVLTFTRALAAELAGDGIRVNALAPGLILGTSFHATHTTRESAEATIRGLPLGRAGNPDDIARACLFLAAEYDGFMTGATLDINGGAYMA